MADDKLTAAKKANQKAAKATKKAVKANAEATAEVAKNTAKKTQKAAKKGAEVTKETAKKAAQKAEVTTKETAGKIKASAENSKKKRTKPKKRVVIQYYGREVREDELLERAMAQFAALEGAIPITKIVLYIKPEDMAAYYVINEQYTGRVDF